MCLAVPGEIISVGGESPLLRTGRVRFGGIVKEVSLALLPEAAQGDFVLVHAGLAINRIDADEARRVFETLDALGELEALGEADPA